MSYTAGSSAITLNQSSGGFIVADEAYVQEPYTKKLTVSGAGVKYTNITVSNGGWVSVGQSTQLNGATICSGGSVILSKSIYASGLTISSGASMIQNANIPVLIDLNVQSGGYVNDIRHYASFGGAETYIASGAIAKATGIYASGGVIYNWSKGTTQATAVFFMDGITLSGGTVDQQVYLLSGAVADGMTVVNSVLCIRSAGYAKDITVTGGHMGTNAYAYAISLGGQNMNFARGQFGYGPVDSGVWEDNDLYAENGKLYGLHVNNSTWSYTAAGKTCAAGYLQNLTLADGISAIAPEIGKGGKLAVTNGAGVSGAVVLNSGKLDIASGCSALAPEISSGGIVTISEGAQLVGGEINSGGSLIMMRSAYAENLTISSGGSMIHDGNIPVLINLKVQSGGYVNDIKTYTSFGGANTYIASGTIAKATGIYASDGVIYNWSKGATAAATVFFMDGITISGGVVEQILHLMGGATADNMTVLNNVLCIRSGGYAKDITVSNGHIGTNVYAYPISLGGRNMKFAAGQFGYGPVESGVWEDNDLYAESGFLYGLHVNNSTWSYTAAGKSLTAGYLQNLTLADGISAIAPEIGKGGKLAVTNGAGVSGAVVLNSGKLEIGDGGSAFAAVISNGGALTVGFNGSATDIDILTGGVADIKDGGEIGGTVQASGTGIVRVYNGGSAEGASVLTGNIHISSGGQFENGIIAGGTMTVAENGKASVFEQTGGRILVRGSDAAASGVTVYGGNMSVGNGGALEDATISGGTVVVRHVAGWAYADIKSATASDVRIETGAGLTLESGGILQAGKLASGANLTIYKGGKAALTSAAAGATIDISFWDVNAGHGNTDAIITDWGDFSADAKINVFSTESAYSYKIADTANANATLYIDNTAWGVYGNAAVKSGEIFANAFTGKSYDFSDGTTLSFGSVTVGTKTGDASALTSADAITGGRAIKWNSVTGVTSGNIFLAGDMTSGQAWVELDGYTGGADTTLYGAQGNSFATGTVNIYAKSGSLRNLAAGANAGGTVAAVNLTVDGAELDGTGYVGGFGNVTGKTATKISTGTFAKDFYAGALANKLDSVTSVGDVSMTIDGGTFSGNIYGASAVKTDTTKGNGTRHTAGDVTLTVTGGSTTKGTQACIFAGGYATGDATGTVYTVDSVTANISGGSWGTAAGGRGVFGGIFASGVTAEAGNVNITVSGDATMGNVYGGGWAQKTNGKSIVGDVNLTISGGTIANVFGGGSHSTSGGTTETGDITITVSGGNITGDIYARGQLDGDTTGAASVIFTGANDFDCGVFGYSYVGGAASDAALSFSTYTGEFSGNIGGFNGITFDGATAMTLDTAAADVSNGKWVFDLTDRAEVLAGTSLLTWSGADFAGDSVKVSFADDAQAQGGWNIAAVAEAFSGTTFDVEVGGSEIVSGLAYNQQIADGDYAGWGFSLDEGVLKFKNLA